MVEPDVALVGQKPKKETAKQTRDVHTDYSADAGPVLKKQPEPLVLLALARAGPSIS